MMRQFALFLCLLAVGFPARGGDPLVVNDAGREAFSRPLAGLTESERERFFRGRSLFNQSWVVAPAKDDRVDGLGPLYNRLACVSCHARNGRGLPPERPDERMQSMLVRLSVAGQGAQGGPRPHPAYGDQFNEEGVPGVAGEGRVSLRWVKVVHRLPEGERVPLRRPQLAFSELAYGPMGRVLTSPRVGQQMVGMGLLDAVPAEALEAMANAPRVDGVKGRVNRVWNPESGKTEAGRFGYKANMPSLRAQIAGAFLGDLGITSALHPDENCSPVQLACRKAPTGGAPELGAEQLDEVEFYLAHLAVPARRDADSPAVRRGEALFAAAGCSQCHRPNLNTGPSPRFPLLALKTIAPYTDLLIHDMGAGLGDGRPDFLASGREWRTPPLWGIGLTATISEAARYLHDGRARSLGEAILWHGGEAKVARRRFARLGKADREDLLTFLKSL
jgi:CxxC motif-containing protein (DUF1111 family)